MRTKQPNRRQDWKRHIVLYAFWGSCILSVLILNTKILYAGIYAILLVPLFALFFIFPFLLTLLNLFFLICPKTEGASVTAEGCTVIVGVISSGILLNACDIQFFADWNQVLYNNQLHSPIATQNYPTVIALSLAGIAGYLILTFAKIERMPPLAIVASIAGMYLGVLECALWIVQIFPYETLKEGGVPIAEFYLCLFPFNCILIAAKTIRIKIRQWNAIGKGAHKTYEKRYLNTLNRILSRAGCWPIYAFLLFWPLFGLFICILALFGQRPDAYIKAFTETADWNLSTKIPPQNIFYDEHYLCTVAAGGHRKIVKPLRKGMRHGHEVIVNRQLCIANAFEQILEERLPRIHRRIRHFYDTYGFPVARLIRARWIADCIYFLMKPLEWFFLIVLYFCDVNPENRIAVQYLPFKASFPSK